MAINDVLKGSEAWHIEQGDCLEILRQIPAGSVDAVVTDPPYGIDYQSARRTDPTKRLKKIANDGQPFVWWLLDAFRITKPDGALICFCRWDVQEAFRQAIEWAGYTVKSQVIWDREVHGLGDLNAAYAPQHDVIWFATKGKFAFPSGRPMSVLRSQRLSGDQLTHPNEKPVDLMAQICRQVTPPGGGSCGPVHRIGRHGRSGIAGGVPVHRDRT